jgi:hypothetical protein
MPGQLDRILTGFALSSGVGLFVPKAEQHAHNLRHYHVYLLIVVRYSALTCR